MEQHQHSQHQQILYTTLNRISSLGDKRLFDWLLRRLLHSGGAVLADGSSAFFPGGDCLVTFVSGDRATGLTFNVAVGVGFKRDDAQPNADDPDIIPIVITAQDSFQTDNSHATLDRIDRVFLKPDYADENSQSVNIIDPVTKNIAADSRFLNRAYRYELQYVAGTPDASPVAPAPPSGFVAGDAIAEILVRAGSGAFNVADLTDLRDILEIADGLVTGTAADLITTRGDVIRGDASGNAERLAKGTAGQVFTSDANDALWVSPETLAAAYPPGHLYGLSLVRQAVDRVQIQVGKCRDQADTVNMVLAAALAKPIDTDWAVGDGAGGFPETELAGPVQNNTWYHVFLIRNAAGVVDAGYDTSLTATNLLTESGYVEYRRLGSVLTDGSAQIIDFVQAGDEFLWKDPPLDVDAASPGTSAVTRTLSVAPDVKVEAFVHVVTDTSSGGQIYLSSLDVNDEAPSWTSGPLATVFGSADGTAQARVRTNTSRQIRSRNEVNETIRIATLGWIDPRGRV